MNTPLTACETITMEDQHHKLDYVEFPAHDLTATKHFFSIVFGWKFEDYGTDYIAFDNSSLKGGFYRSNQRSETASGSALLVIYSDNLEHTQSSIEKAGGCIVKPVFSFPGGRRFHFADPSGNELAVWSDQ